MIDRRSTPINLHRAGSVLLLLALFAQLLFSAGLKSPTIDEPNHLARGYGYLKTGDPRMSRDEGHPVLLNLICALPLSLFPDMPPPEQFGGWHSGFRNAFAIELVFSGAIPVDRLFFVSRLPVMLLTLCLAALAGRWAGELYGPWGRTLALVLCAFDPNLIAHGRLVTTDLGMTVSFFLAVYLFWRFLQSPSMPALLLAGVAVGLAQNVKFSAVLVFPMLALMGLMETLSPAAALRLIWRRRPLGSRWLSSLGVLAGALGILTVSAGLVTWTVYGFSYGTPAGWTVSVPAPIYVEGLAKTLGHAGSMGHPAFLMGQRSMLGWWYYFPVALVLKTPLPSLLGFAGALVAIFWRRLARAEWILLVVPAVYLTLAMRSVLNIGYRHLLPMLPFLWVYVGRLGFLLERGFAAQRSRWFAAVATALVLWLAVDTLRIAPDYLAYFGLLAGGPEGGWRYLVDSNLDWGQDLPGLATYIEQRPDSRLHLSWFGATYPYLYGLNLESRLLPSHYSYPYVGDAARSGYNPIHPAPGLYAISATNLQGVGLGEGDVFAPFRDKEPLARIGYSVFLYEVPDLSLAANPTCISGMGFEDLSPQTMAYSLGRGPGAVKWFDHNRSFVLPGTGDPVYVLPAAPLGFVPAWRDGFLSRASVLHAQNDDGRYPGAMVYHVDQETVRTWVTELVSAVGAEPVGWSSAAVFDESAEIHPLDTPVDLDYGLQMVGYHLLSGEKLEPGHTVELVTVWRATGEVPAKASDLRIFGHVLDRQGRFWGGEDRLDLEPPTWEEDDLLVQYHRIPLPADAPIGVYQVEVGMYTTLPLGRLTVYDGGVAVADRLLLQPVIVGNPNPGDQ